MYVVNTLNAMDWYAIPENIRSENDIMIWPNHAFDQVTIDPGTSHDVTGWQVKIFYLMNQEIFCHAIKKHLTG